MGVAEQGTDLLDPAKVEDTTLWKIRNTHKIVRRWGQKKELSEKLEVI